MHKDDEQPNAPLVEEASPTGTDPEGETVEDAHHDVSLPQASESVEKSDLQKPTCETNPTKSAGYWDHTPRSFWADRRIILALFILLSALYFPGLGSYGLYDPWETHYGEVARNMVEHDNYIDPYWGSPWDTASVKRERAGFYSKPLLIMWMMAGGMNLFSFNELGVRFFFPLIMLLALMAIYLAVSRFYNRRAGLLATLITATAPFIAFMSRQAVTDGPLVALMTAGMMALAIGLFLCDEEEEASPLLYWLTLGLVIIVGLGQLWAILPMDRSPDVVRDYPGSRGLIYSIQWWFREVFTVGLGKGWVVSAALLPIVGWAAWRVGRQRRRKMLYIYLFYICCGLVVPAKGWLGWAPMGGAILGYLIVTGEWRILGQVDIPAGLLIVFVTGHLWIVAMLAGHHPGWYNRFILHDHYKRLFSGVHSIDKGGFEYFFRWLGYGLFPWIGLLPAAIIRVLGNLRGKTAEYTPRQKFQLLMFFWAVFGFFLFSKSSTKFHHYILPIVPPLAILIALFLEDVIRGRGRHLALLLACAAGLTIWVGQDVYRMPAAYGQGSQNLVNLFTYKYDREWAKYTSAQQLESLQGESREKAEQANQYLTDLSNPWRMMSLIAVLGFLLLGFTTGWLKEAGLLAVLYAGVWCAIWCLQTYLPTVAEDWSQKRMWDAYYAHCETFGPDEEDAYRKHMVLTTSRVPSKPEMFPRVRCKEPIVAFRTNWRGETFYSANTVMPSMETKYLKPFLEIWGNDKPFYLFTERSRVKSELEPNLPKHLKGQYKEIFGDNRKFVLLHIYEGAQPKKATTEKPKKKAKKAAKPAASTPPQAPPAPPPSTSAE